MWPFSRSAEHDIDAAMAQAIAVAAERWAEFERTTPLAPNINLRDRIAFFHGPFLAEIRARLPALAAAPPEMELLIIAEGVARSGAFTRDRIEAQLGIVLPS